MELEGDLELVQLAYRAFIRTHHPQQRLVDRIDPWDPVALLHPIIRNMNPYSITNPLVPVSCAESALTLVLAWEWREWRDKADNRAIVQAGARNAPACLEVRAPEGLTMHEMVRRLMRIGMRDFPVYELDPVTFSTELVSGSPRKDSRALLFVPQHTVFPDGINPLRAAHWAFVATEKTTYELPPQFPLPFHEVVPKVVFSSSPVVGDATCFWRAKVTPENQALFEESRQINRACSCDWRLKAGDLGCIHQQAFQNEFGAMAEQTQVLTLEGSTHVVGSLRAEVERVFPPFQTVVTSETDLALLYPNGTRQEMPNARSDLIVKGKGLLNYMKSAATSNPYLHLNRSPLGNQIRLGHFLVKVKQFSDEFDTWSLSDLTVLQCLYTGITGTPSNIIAELECVAPKKTWASTEDLHLRLPRKAELLARLATKVAITEQVALDVVKRMAAEERWDVDINCDEMRVWLKRVATEQGQASMIPAPGPSQCWTCLQEKPQCGKIYRHMCKHCRYREYQPEPVICCDTLVVHVGFYPIWSRKFNIPVMPLKSDVMVEQRVGNGRRKKTWFDGLWDTNVARDALVSHLQAHLEEPSCRGYLRGPMIMSWTPSCFPKGYATAILAFLVRLGADYKMNPSVEFYERLFDLTSYLIDPLEPESFEDFIKKFSGEKRQKNLEGRADMDEGWLKPCPTVTMTGFGKAEKSHPQKWDCEATFIQKPEEKPRFICSPNPAILARIGRWTHAQTKWLARKFTWEDNLYYAGCSTPEELNLWLNRTLECGEPWSLADDITAIDSNHSRQSFEFHAKVRWIQFAKMSDWIAQAYNGEETVSVRVGAYQLTVCYVNASGVSDTSYKNSLLCLLIRWLAVCAGYVDILKMSQADQRYCMDEALRCVPMAAAGDDGLVRLPDSLFGVKTQDFNLERYREVWAEAGFLVKVAILPPHRWRMATFLAMRPLWTGERYEWSPEPARRLKGAFWQLDNSMHPIAWARGIATQFLTGAKACPVLGRIAAWYLRNTKGPIILTRDDYGVMSRVQCTGTCTPRTIEEFCLDYHVTKQDFDVFYGMLDSTADVLVNLTCFLLKRICDEES